MLGYILIEYVVKMGDGWNWLRIVFVCRRWY